MQHCNSHSATNAIQATNQLYLIDDPGNGAIDYDFDEAWNDRSSGEDERKPHEVEYQSVKPSDIRKTQSAQVEQVSSVLDLAPETSAILLHFMRWNRDNLMELYTDQPEKMAQKVGLDSDFPFSPDTTHSSDSPRTEVLEDFECRICFEGAGVETFAMRCGHRFCVDCYRYYLSSKIQEGESAEIKCPHEKCNRVVGSRTIEFILDDALKKRSVYFLAIRLFFIGTYTLEYQCD